MKTMNDDMECAVAGGFRTFDTPDDLRAMEAVFDMVRRGLAHIKTTHLPLVIPVSDPQILDHRAYDDFVEEMWDRHGVHVERDQGLSPMLPEYFVRAYMPEAVPRVQADADIAPDEDIEAFLAGELMSYELRS